MTVAAWTRDLARFLRAEDGNIAILFGAALVSLLVGVGVAVDYGRAVVTRERMANAADAAALALGSWQGLTAEQRNTKLNQFFEANYPPQSLGTVGTLTVSTQGSDTIVSVTGSVNTYFLNIIGIDAIDVGATSVVTAGMGTLEVVMALDLSGSMNDGNKIGALRQAATNLANTLFDLAQNSTKPDPIKIGLVPFAGSVKVGPQYANASWMDTQRLSPVHGDNFTALDPNATRPNIFTLFNRMSNASWAGCVEERPMPHQVTDSTPTTQDPVTLFVPLLAPDEPDNWTCLTTSGNCVSGCSCYTSSRPTTRWASGAPSGTYNQNNYLRDNRTISSCTSANYQNCTGRQNDTVNEPPRYTQIDPKYGTSTNGVSVQSNLTVAGLPGGPNFWCTTPAVTPLTTSRSTIVNTISNYQAQGATNILAGIMWGWRLLSPNEPFTEGRPYNTAHNQKVIVLMTDGENTYYPRNNALKSWFGAFGYVANPTNRLNSNSQTASVLTGIMNDRTKQACANAKAQGIVIYSVAFDLYNSEANNVQAAIDVMKQCASDEDKYFEPGSNHELLQAFYAIGHDISQLRIAY